MSFSTFGCTDEPVVIKWGNSEQHNYIGAPTQHLRMNISLGTEASPKLLFWFSVRVGVRMRPDSLKLRTKLLYFVVPASSLDFNGEHKPFTLENPNPDNSVDTSAALREAGIHSDPASVNRICFQLHDHGTVFMPPMEEHAFIPESDNVSQLLVSMQSLSQAKQFWVYTSLDIRDLTNLWKKMDQILKGTFTCDFTTERVYKPGMVRDKWTNFNLFVARETPAKRQSTLHDADHQSGPPPLYIMESQGAGMKRKAERPNTANDPLCESGVSGTNLPSNNRDSRLVDTESREGPGAEPQRKRRRTTLDTTSSDIQENIDPSGLNSNPPGINAQSPQVQVAEPHKEVSRHLEEQLAGFILWVLQIDPRLEKDMEQILLEFGGAVVRGDAASFLQMKSLCMAKIYCTYEKRGSQWFLRRAF